MIGLKIGLTIFSLLLISLGVFQGIKYKNKIMMIFMILFSILLIVVTWITIK